MTHEFESGAFFNGKAAWHGLGQVFDGAMAPRDAFAVANADWDVLSLPVRDDDGQPEKGWKRIVRADTKKLLHVHPDTYIPVQNSRLIEVAESLERYADISAVCVLREGKRVTFTSELKDAKIDVVKGDTVSQYIVGATSHDGSIAFSVLFSPIRVVCQNTLSAALGVAGSDASKILKVRHTKNCNSLIDHLPKLIDCQRQTFKGGLAELQAMAAKPCQYEDFKGYVSAVFADQLSGKINAVRGQASTARARTIDDLPQWQRLQNLFYGQAIGSEIAGVNGTYWGAYNAVTQWVTHESVRTKDQSEAARQRLESLYWGKNADTLTKAHTLALAATRG